MPDAFVIAVPVRDRRRAHDFLTAVLGLEAFGEPAPDGLPEPLQLRLGPETALMCVPAGGFAGVIGDREVAAAGVTECQLGVRVADPAAVDAALERAAGAGGAVVVPAARQPWGYTGSFADPDGHLWSVLAD